jgi:methyl-accepting chemotaxis protein
MEIPVTSHPTARNALARLGGGLMLWQKLLLPFLGLATLVLVFGAMYLQRLSTKAEATRMALDVGRFAEALSPMLIYVSDHRGQMGSFFRGEADAKDAAHASEARIDAQIAKIDALDKEVGLRIASHEDWVALRAKWSELEARVFSLDETRSRQAHLELIAALTDTFHSLYRRASLEAGDESELRLMELILDRLPQAVAVTADLRGKTASAVKGGKIADKTKGQLLDLLADMRARTREMARFAASEHDIGGLADLHTALATAIEANERLLGDLDTSVFTPDEPTVGFEAVFSRGTVALQAMQALASSGTSILSRRLEADLRSARVSWAVAAVVASLALLGAALVTALVIRSTSRSVRRTVAVLERIGAGELNNEISAYGRDELAQLNRALGTMQHKLRQQIETERALAAQNARVRQALDKVSTGVVLADADHRVIYANEAAQAMFSRCAARIRHELPAFDPNLTGQAVYELSKAPREQRQMIESLHSSDMQDIQLGGYTFHVVTNPVVNDAGERLGTVQEWTDRSPEVAVQAELQNMLGATLQGDLSQRIELAGKSGFFQRISHGVNELAENLTTVVSSAKSAAAEFFRGADEISEGNTNLSRRTEAQAASLEETASSMEELTSTVKQNGDNSAQANKYAIQARDLADKGGRVVIEAIRAMETLSEASKRIAEIISVVDETAFQTNLLALNAAVEAARAGEHGRGFAVVASEVRNLAGRSAASAKQIRALIQDSVARVDHGSALVAESGQTLQEIVRAVKKLADLVAEIDAAGREQTGGIEQINLAITQLDQATQENAALVEQISAASKSVRDQAGALNQLMAGYRVPGEAAAPARAAA